MAMPKPTPIASKDETPVLRPVPGREAEGVVARFTSDASDENVDNITGLSFPFPLSMGGDELLHEPIDDGG